MGGTVHPVRIAERGSSRKGLGDELNISRPEARRKKTGASSLAECFPFHGENIRQRANFPMRSIRDDDGKFVPVGHVGLKS